MPEEIPQVQVTTSNKTSWKKIGLTILIILVVTGLIAGVYWFFVLPGKTDVSDLTGPVPKPNVTTSTPSATSSTQKDDSANWKVYSDTRLKFQIKHPSTWTVSVNDQESSSSKEPGVIQRTVTLKKGQEHIKIYEGGAFGFGGEVPKTETLKIGDNDLDFNFYTFSDDQYGYMGKEDLNLPDRNEVIGFFIVIDKKNFDKDLSEIKKILSTFKFLD